VLTSDTLFNGKLVVRQEKDGYRFSLDAVLLAGLTRVKPEDRIVDLGTGCGIVPLILAYRKGAQKILGMELQPDLARLAEQNVEANGFADRIEIRRMDFRDVARHVQAQSFDLVTSNPPYRRLDTGKINPHPQKALARHELTASIREVFAAGKHLLVQGGRLVAIYPAARMAHLLSAAQEHGFSPKELTIVYSHAGGAARLVCLESRKGGGEELLIRSPFYIYKENREYTEEMQAFYDD
jgi:tRNA1Val (adenine37-N6)-methyltransferase